MQHIYSDQPPTWNGPSLFLARPTPRRADVASWRPAAIAHLAAHGFTGTVLIPERHAAQAQFDYLDQVEWEFAALERADLILFWIPRDTATLPGFTTNVEFGRYLGRRPLLYGRPEGRPHNRYLDWLYEKLTQSKPIPTLDALALAATKWFATSNPSQE